MKALISTLAIALMLAACEGGPSSPTQPSVVSPTTSPTTSPATSQPTATPDSSPVAEWSVIQRFVSVIGPDNCWVREQRARLTGATFPDLPMTTTRSGSSIVLESDFFQVNYAGTLSGNDFTASGGPLTGGGRPCQDGTLFQQTEGVSDLSGRIADDGQQLTATEVNSYRLTSGEPVTYTWDWQATRED